MLLPVLLDGYNQVVQNLQHLAAVRLCERLQFPPQLVIGHRQCGAGVTCIYGFAGRNPPDTQFKCANAATGKIAWENDMQWREGGRVNGFFRGSLLRAGERVFSLGEDGAFAELKLTPEGVETTQRLRLFTAREAWTLPALHRGLLYVSQNSADAGTNQPPRLICYDFRGR